jgi:hypothetical protein
VTSAAWYYPVIAGAGGCLISFTELNAVKRKRLALKASPWIASRLATDGSSSASAYAVLLLVFKGLEWFSPIWAAGVAILIGPTLLRAQLSLIGSGDERSVGPATAFRRIQKIIDDNIDDIGAVAQSKWINKKVLPSIDKVGIDDLYNQVADYVNSLDRFSDQEKSDELEFFQRTISDTSITDRVKRRVMVTRLLDRRCVRFVRQLTKSSPK